MVIPEGVATEPGERARGASAAKRLENGADSPSPNSNRPAPGLVGARLRERRLAKGITLRQFARDVGVSASFISQLETGKTQPSVATFFAVCAALGTSIDELLDDDNEASSESNGDLTDVVNNSWGSLGGNGAELTKRSRPGGASSAVVRPHERKVLTLDSGVTWESLTSSHRNKTDFMLVRYEVGGSSTLEERLIRHVGSEYGFILSGTLQVDLGFETLVLNAGDSIAFDSSRPHRLYNVGNVPVEAVWLNLEFQGD
ncbi:MAG: helix-turn-helix domain-containing protein [Acidimicrobiales bacterium]